MTKKPFSTKFKKFIRSFQAPGVMNVEMPIEAFLAKRVAYREAMLADGWNGSARALPHFWGCSCAFDDSGECNCGVKALSEGRRMKFALQYSRFALTTEWRFLREVLHVLHQQKRWFAQETRDRIQASLARHRQQRRLLHYFHPDEAITRRLGLRIVDADFSA